MRGYRGLGLLALSVLAAGCGLGEAETGEQPERVRQLQPMDVVTATEERIEEGLAISGPLDPYRTTEVRAQLAGELLSVRVERGTAVETGSVLATYDGTTVRSQLLGARAAVAAAESAVAAAAHRLEAADALYAAKAMSQQDVRQARSGAEAAMAQLAAARAQLAQAEEAGQRTVVRAPTRGIVSARLASAGEAVGPGQPLFRIVSTDTLELAARVPVGGMGSFQRGDRVLFRVDEASDRPLTGYVDRIEPMADPSTRQVVVYARLPNPGRALVGGLYATGTIVVRTVAGAALPAAAVAGDPEGGRYVLVIENGRAERRTVRVVGEDRDTGRVVVEGVEVGTQVVAWPDGLDDGAAVRIADRPDAPGLPESAAGAVGPREGGVRP